MVLMGDLVYIIIVCIYSATFRVSFATPKLHRISASERSSADVVLFKHVYNAIGMQVHKIEVPLMAHHYKSGLDQC
jgi:hypothetical protein